MSWLYGLQLIAALVVLAESLNKIHRSDIFEGIAGTSDRIKSLAWLLRPLAWRRDRVIIVLKVFGWFLLSTGAVMELVQQLLSYSPRWYEQAQAMCFTCGFALLIVRSRLKEE